MSNPKNLKYTKEHQWVKIDNDIAVVGITDFAQKQLTDIVFVELPQKGKHTTQNMPMAVVESVKSVSDVYAPLSGEIVEINEELKNNPEMINKDCYGKGWFVKVRIEDKNEIKNLISADEYERFASSSK